MVLINLIGLFLGRLVPLDTKYGFEFDSGLVKKNVTRLTNQLWKLIPMRENEEDWNKQLKTVITEIAGFNEVFSLDTQFLSLLSKLEGLLVVDYGFDFYRKTIFECISLLQGLYREQCRQKIS